MPLSIPCQAILAEADAYVVALLAGHAAPSTVLGQLQPLAWGLQMWRAAAAGDPVSTHAAAQEWYRQIRTIVNRSVGSV